MVDLWMRKRDMGDDNGNNVEDKCRYEKSGVRLAWLSWKDIISVLLHVGLEHVPTVLGMVNWLACEILLSPSYSWWFALSPLLSLFLVLNSTITLEHKVKSSFSISPYDNQELTLSTATPCKAYTKYSIHWVQHTPSTAYTVYCIHCEMRHPKIDCLPLPDSLSSLGRPCWTQFSKFPSTQHNQWIESQLLAHLCFQLLPPDWLAQSTPPISLDHGLQVHLQTCPITAFKCITPNVLNHRLQVCTPMASKCISPMSLDHGLQVHF